MKRYLCPGLVAVVLSILSVTSASAQAEPALFMRGDANDDGEVTLADVIYLAQYLFGAGPLPLPNIASGDANCDGRVTPLDAVYLVNYTLRGGPEPKCPA